MLRNMVIGILVIAVLMMFVVKTAFPSYEKVAKTRVTNVLNGMKEGTGTGSKVETAMAMWADGKLRITDRDRLSWASDHFDKWRREKKLYRPTGEFTIDDVEITQETEQFKEALVSFTLEGKPYKVRVPSNSAIAWHE